MHSAAFWDRIAEKYFKQPIADPEAYEKKLALTRDILRPDMNILEFGCGTGGTAIAHVPYVNHITAIDISQKMIEIARKQASDAGVGNVAFEVGDMSNVDTMRGPFDAILGMSILHLLKDRRETITKVHAMLKPGGVFVSSTGCVADRMAFMKLIAPIGRALGAFPYFAVFTEDELKSEITAAGFDIEHAWRPKGGKAIAVFIIARKRES